MLQFMRSQRVGHNLATEQQASTWWNVKPNNEKKSKSQRSAHSKFHLYMPQQYAKLKSIYCLWIHLICNKIIMKDGRMINTNFRLHPHPGGRQRKGSRGYMKIVKALGTFCFLNSLPKCGYLFYYSLKSVYGLPRWLSGEESAWQCKEAQEIWVWSLGQEDPLEEEMATRSSILAWEMPEQRSLVGYSPWGCKELDTTEQLNMYICKLCIYSYLYSFIEVMYVIIKNMGCDVYF